jgi:hypothetical protein
MLLANNIHLLLIKSSIFNMAPVSGCKSRYQTICKPQARYRLCPEKLYMMIKNQHFQAPGCQGSLDTGKPTVSFGYLSKANLIKKNSDLPDLAGALKYFFTQITIQS